MITETIRLLFLLTWFCGVINPQFQSDADTGVYWISDGRVGIVWRGDQVWPPPPLHIHSWSPPMGPVRTYCLGGCGAYRDPYFISEPCSAGDGRGCLVLHGHYEYGPVVEVGE